MNDIDAGVNTAKSFFQQIKIIGIIVNYYYGSNLLLRHLDGLGLG
jgi:hypothetical protein